MKPSLYHPEFCNHVKDYWQQTGHSYEHIASRFNIPAHNVLYILKKYKPSVKRNEVEVLNEFILDTIKEGTKSFSEVLNLAICKWKALNGN